MKKSFIFIPLLAFILFASVAKAQVPVPLGKGSYASFTPRYQYLENNGYYLGWQEIFVDDAESKRPIPTNDWWTQMLVDMINKDGFVGNLWVYPHRTGGDAYGAWIDIPSEWNDGGTTLNPKSRLKVLGDGFKATTHRVRSWSDWGVVYALTDQVSKEIEVTISNGCPFTWIDFKNVMPELNFAANATFYRRDGLKATFPYRSDCVCIEVDGDYYGIFLPENTVIEKGSCVLNFRFTGDERYMVVAAMKNADDMDFFYQYAFNKIVDTRLDWEYDEPTAKIKTIYTVTTKNLRNGTNGPALQGFLPHHYRDSEMNFSLLDLWYQTCRGKMYCATGNRFEITYPFNGLIPYDPAPSVSNSLQAPYRQELLDEHLQVHAYDLSYAGDTYYGGKDLQQKAQMMAYAYATGNMEMYEKMKANLENNFKDWYTYTPGEEKHYFALLNMLNWDGFSGYDNGERAELGQDVHLSMGYFAHAFGVLALFDPQFAQDYGEMAVKSIKQYANWDRNDKSLPWLRTFSPWFGHSNTGPFGDGGGNGQESSSEAMQAWGGLYMLAIGLKDKEMRDAAIMGYTIESRAVGEYWFDINRDKYEPNVCYEKFGKQFEGMAGGDSIFMLRPYSSHLQNRGPGWWTWYSGNPLQMNCINWLPMSSCLKYLYAKPDYNRWIYQVAEEQRATFLAAHAINPRITDSNPGFSDAERPMNNSVARNWLGQVMLSFQQTFDPEGVAELWDKMYSERDQYSNITEATTGNPTSPLCYYMTHSHLTYGDIRWDMHCDDPTSTSYLHPTTGRRCYAMYNNEDHEKKFTFYNENQQAEISIGMPANKYVCTCSDAYLDSIEVTADVKTVEPNGFVNLRAIGYDQYGAISSLQGVTWEFVEGTGTLARNNADTLYLYQANNSVQDRVIIKVSKRNSVGRTVVGYDTIRVNARPEIASITISPTPMVLQLDATETFTVTAVDQYGEPYEPQSVVWTLEGTSQITSEGEFTATTPGRQTIKVTADGLTAQHELRVLPQLENIALNKPITTGSRPNNATRLNDGNMTNNWEAQNCDLDPANNIVTIDLEQIYLISGVRIYWKNSAQEYKVWFSEDNVNWTCAYHETLGAGEVDNSGLGAVYGIKDVDDIAISGTARYVRLEPILKSGRYCFSMYEIEVYGTQIDGAPVLAALDIEPGGFFNQDETIQFQLRGYDQFGDPFNLGGQTIVWSADKGEMNNGTYVATQYGNVKISAVCGGLSTYKTIFVNAVEKAATIDVTPASANLVQTGSLPFTTRILTAFGFPLDAANYPITWSIDGAANGCTITQDGVFTAGNTPGDYTVRATSGEATGTAIVHISNFNNLNLATYKNCWASSQQYN
ncbi:MAG: discoidin domain-containing protein, partial [Paludibacteraceae bacterium]|nr:discoidin domain-containing protein [Paludibacteraceae bacterium]